MDQETQITLLEAMLDGSQTAALFTDFENFSEFKPAELHLTNVTVMLDEVNAWAGALKTVREKQAVNQ